MIVLETFICTERGEWGNAGSNDLVTEIVQATALMFDKKHCIILPAFCFWHYEHMGSQHFKRVTSFPGDAMLLDIFYHRFQLFSHRSHYSFAKTIVGFFLGQPYQGDVAINVQGSRAPPTDRVEGHTKITVALAVVYFRILRVYDHDGTLIEDLSRQSHGQDPRTTAHGV